MALFFIMLLFNINNLNLQLDLLNILDFCSLIFIFWGFQGFLQNWGLYLSYIISMELLSVGFASWFVIFSSLNVVSSLGLAYGILLLIILALESAIILTILANLCALKVNNNKIPHFTFLKIS